MFIVGKTIYTLMNSTKVLKSFAKNANNLEVISVIKLILNIRNKTAKSNKNIVKQILTTLHLFFFLSLSLYRPWDQT